MGVILGVAVTVGVIGAFFWAIDALSILKRQQLEILQALARIEATRDRPAPSALPNDR